MTSLTSVMSRSLLYFAPSLQSLISVPASVVVFSGVVWNIFSPWDIFAPSLHRDPSGHGCAGGGCLRETPSALSASAVSVQQPSYCRAAALRRSRHTGRGDWGVQDGGLWQLTAYTGQLDNHTQSHCNWYIYIVCILILTRYRAVLVKKMEVFLKEENN